MTRRSARLSIAAFRAPAVRLSITARGRHALFVALALIVQSAHPAGSSHVTFAETTPLSGNRELARRMLSPLTALALQRTLARSGNALGDQPIDLENESFAVYVPPAMPAGGYGILVFVPPWDDTRLPEGWASVLDQFDLIFVSAARSGNGASDLGRREPLALAAEENVRKLQHVDPSRVFVAGFSGGARVAMRLALAYPDVFRGAILDAGSDPIGTSAVPLPPRDLFQKFRTSSQLVYVAGDADLPGQRANRSSIQSMRDWCMFNSDNQLAPFAGHVVADAGALARAIRTLLTPLHSDPDALSQCQTGIEDRLSAQLHNAQMMILDGKRPEARRLLTQIDAEFGGLAAPAIVELAERNDAVPQ